MDLKTVVVSGAVGAVTSLITAYFTAKLKISEEREKWFREFTAKYSEALAANPALAQAMSTQFAVAMLMVSDPTSSNGYHTKYFLMPNSRVVAGRGPTCAVPVTDPAFSMQQVAFFVRENDVFLETLGSGRPTYLNGNVVEGPTRFRAGDSVRVGETHFSLVMLSR